MDYCILDQLQLYNGLPRLFVTIVVLWRKFNVVLSGGTSPEEALGDTISSERCVGICAGVEHHLPVGRGARHRERGATEDYRLQHGGTVAQGLMFCISFTVQDHQDLVRMSEIQSESNPIQVRGQKSTRRRIMVTELKWNWAELPLKLSTHLSESSAMIYYHQGVVY